MFKEQHCHLLIVLAESVSFSSSIASMAIPKVLDWRRELTAVSPLTRSLFWTYAGYTLGIHLSSRRFRFSRRMS
jgi:hypothetical protein